MKTRILLILSFILSLGGGFESVAGQAVNMPAPASVSAKQPETTTQPNSTTLADHPELQQAFTASVGQTNSTYPMQPTEQGWQSHNPRQQYDAIFGEQGVTIQAGADNWQIEVSQYGRTTQQLSVTVGVMQIEDNRLTYERAGWTEWYVNGRTGLQQGFTLQHPPSVEAEGAIRLTMQLSGTFQAELRDEKLYLNGENDTELMYGGLVAYDATGQTLPAHLELATNQLTIGVDDRHATYPITIDPWIQQQKLGAEPDGTDETFGRAVAIDGATALIGVADNDNGNDAGAAYVFVWGGTTWSQQAKLILPDLTSNDLFGHAVAL